jgi:hypothetical protein
MEVSILPEDEQTRTEACVPQWRTNTHPVSRTPHAVLQIDWPLWPCDCCVVEWLVQSVEGKVALWSFTPESDLEIYKL